MVVEVTVRYHLKEGADPRSVEDIVVNHAERNAHEMLRNPSAQVAGYIIKSDMRS